MSGLSPSGEPQDAAALIATDDEDQARGASRSPPRARSRRRPTRTSSTSRTRRRGERRRRVRRLPRAGHRGRASRPPSTRARAARTLSDDEDYNKALDERLRRPARALLRQLAAVPEGVPQGAALPESFEQFFKEPFVATFDADDDGVRLRGHGSRGARARRSPFFGQGSDLLDDMPARLLARDGADRLREAARLLRRRVRGRGRRPRRDRAAVQGRHRPRPPAGRDRLDGRLRHLRARHERVGARRRAHHRDQGRAGLRPLDRGGRAARERARADAAQIEVRAAPGGGRVHRQRPGHPEADPRVPGERPRRARLRRRRRRGCGRRRARSSATTPDFTADARLARRLRRLVLRPDAADLRPGRVHRGGAPTRTGRRRSPTSSR